MNTKIETFERIATELGCPVEYPIKEEFLIRVIKQFIENLSLDDGMLVFGGGTSLARGYKIINRFSEDADFRFVPKPKSTKLIRSKLTKCAESLHGFYLEGDKPINDSSKITFRFKQDNIELKHASLRGHIKFEIFFAEKMYYDTIKLPVGSLYNEFEGLSPELELSCVALEETAIDKISSFLWRVAFRKMGSNYESADIRHLHDLSFLNDKIVIDARFKRALAETFQFDMTYRARQIGTLKDVARQVVSTLENNSSYSREYQQYVSNMSYEKDANRLHYNDAVKSLKILFNKLGMN